jgi:hypothetical protein
MISKPYWKSCGVLRLQVTLPVVRVMSRFFINIVLSWSALSAPMEIFAQNQTQRTNEASSRITLPQPKASDLEAEASREKHHTVSVKMRQYEYLGEAPSPDQPTRIYSFLGEWQYDRKFDFFELKSDINLISAERESQTPYIGVPDFFMGLPVVQSRGVKLYLGRKVEEWSAFDEQWKLGIWQPMARWDYIHPETLGLTGAFVELESQFVQLRLFGTPYFLPDQGPNFELKDGRFTSNNRWFWTPQTQIGVLSQPTNLYFNLNRPSEEEVIHHSGLAASLDFGQQHMGPWARVAYSRKPRNQLHLGIDGQVEIFKEGRTQVTIHPEVVYHNVLTFETGLRGQQASFWGSVTHDKPEDPNLPEDWVQSELAEIYVYGAMLEHRLDFFKLRNAKIRYSYMQIDEKENIAEKELLGGSVKSSLDRFMFERVFSVEWVQSQNIKKSLGLRYGFKYFYSIPDDAGLLSLKTELLVGKNLILDLSADILGASEDAEDAGSGLMTRYRSNDRVAVGMTYVF